MIRYHIVTLFPEWFSSPFDTGLFARARAAGIVNVDTVDPRSFTNDPHHTVDDSPYGGGPGMVLMPGPLSDAVRSIPRPGRLIVLTPAGRPFTQQLARELAEEDDITLICGRYEGFDERLFEIFPVTKVSVCDAVLNGGEAGALAVIEATARLQEGFMGKTESGAEESFSNGLLEYPQYTRPAEFESHTVPDVLQKGDHGAIAAWRREQSLLMTLEYRPDLLKTAVLSEADRRFLRSSKKVSFEKNIHFALLHYPVLLKEKFSGTSSLTNLDIHDIARVSRTYRAGSFFVVTPLEDQYKLLETLLERWVGDGASFNADRALALQNVVPAHSLNEAVRLLRDEAGTEPVLIGTSARPETDKKGRERRQAIPFTEVAGIAKEKPVLILLGTAHGLAPEALARCDAILPPIRWMSDYNHLPVRAAAAILLDRIIGE